MNRSSGSRRCAALPAARPVPPRPPRAHRPDPGASSRPCGARRRRSPRTPPRPGRRAGVPEEHALHPAGDGHPVTDHPATLSVRHVRVGDGMGGLPRARQEGYAMTTTLSGRTAVVTGGASGIGRACAVWLAQAGASVVVLDRDEAAAKEVAGQFDGRAVAVDLTDLAAVDRLGLDADILVNNAGIQHVAPVEQFPPE